MTLEDECRLMPTIVAGVKNKHECYLCIWGDYGCPDYRDRPRQLELFKEVYLGKRNPEVPRV